MTQHKYKAKAKEVDGYKFPSTKEAQRYKALKLLEMAGEIKGLELHPRFEIVVNGVKVCRYEADSKYQEKGVEVVEDVKGMKTPVYRLKKKLMKAVHGIEIREV